MVFPLAIRFDALREFLFRSVLQILLNYRLSLLSQGSAGQVHAGDRLPWVALDGADNFAPLPGLDWQVHVYGAADAELSAYCAIRKLPLRTFAWRSEHGTAGLARDALYLLRPDTYVALADEKGAAGAIEDYFAHHGIKPAPSWLA